MTVLRMYTRRNGMRFHGSMTSISPHVTPLALMISGLALAVRLCLLARYSQRVLVLSRSPLRPVAYASSLVRACSSLRVSRRLPTPFVLSAAPARPLPPPGAPFGWPGMHLAVGMSLASHLCQPASHRLLLLSPPRPSHPRALRPFCRHMHHHRTPLHARSLLAHTPLLVTDTGV
jgi:hypothetical protein